MLAVLVKLFGLVQVAVAEDIVQDTLLTALETWKLKGMPDDPKAWLYRTAKNKTIDFLRRNRNFRERVAPAFAKNHQAQAADGKWLSDFFLEDEIEDAQLQMMFACCHPLLPIEAQLSLMLRNLCGLSNGEIAAALLLPEDTVAKRLYRAKEKIKEENLKLGVPSGRDLLPRLDAVLHGIYLLFNEGYKSATAAGVIRQHLCEDALRFCALLARNKYGNLSKTHALLSLLCFQSSRLPARLDGQGDIVLLQDQDRQLWDKSMIALGYQHLRSASKGVVVSEYHLEAAIASYHAAAPSFEQTNWKGIGYCYDLLMQINASPIVALNRGIAIGYGEGAEKGIAALRQISGLEKNYLFHSALGDFLAKSGNDVAAKRSYEVAMGLAKLAEERKVISGKIHQLG